MMLVLSGIPPDMPIAVLRNIIQQSSNVDYVLIEEQQRHSPGEPRSVTVGCPGETAGQQILQCLNGVMLGPHRLYVAPFVSQDQTQSQFFAVGDDPMTGLSNKVPPWIQPQEWSMRRSDVSYHPLPELSCAPPALDARPPYGAVGPHHMQSTLGKAQPVFQARTPSPARVLSPIRERSPIRQRSPFRVRSPIRERSPIRVRSPIRERSPARVWEQPKYGRRGPSPDRQGFDSIIRSSERRGLDMRDSYFDRHDRVGRFDPDAHRNEENRGLTNEARKRVAELDERQIRDRSHLQQTRDPSYFASHNRDDRKAIPSLLQLGGSPFFQRAAPQVPSKESRGYVSCSEFRSESASDRKVDRRPDLARRPADRRTAGAVANVRSLPQPSTNSRQIMSKNNSRQSATSGSLIENAVKKLVQSMFNSRPSPGTGVKPKYRILMEGVKAEIRRRFSSIRGDAQDAESLCQMYFNVYDLTTNRNSKRKSLLFNVAKKINQNHAVKYLLMETPWVSPMPFETASIDQREQLELKIFLNQTSDTICQSWLKPPNMDAVVFAQEIARFDSANSSIKVSSGVLKSEDKDVYDRFKLLTFNSLRVRFVKPQDIIGLTPAKLAQMYMAEQRANRDSHLKEAVGYCNMLHTTYNGVYKTFLSETNLQKPALKQATPVVSKSTDNLKKDILNSGSGKSKKESQATPAKNGDIRKSSKKTPANAGREDLQVDADETADSTPAVKAAGLTLKQSKFLILLDRASQLVSQDCLKPPEMGVDKFVRELHHFAAGSYSSDKVWRGQLTAADTAVYEHFKTLTLRELLALSEAGQEMRNLSSQQIAQVYREKLGQKMQEHLTRALKHCEKLHGTYRGMLNKIQNAKKEKAPQRNRKLTNVANDSNQKFHDNQSKSPEVNIDDIEINMDDLEDF